MYPNTLLSVHVNKIVYSLIINKIIVTNFFGKPPQKIDKPLGTPPTGFSPHRSRGPTPIVRSACGGGDTDAGV